MGRGGPGNKQGREWEGAQWCSKQWRDKQELMNVMRSTHRRQGIIRHALEQAFEFFVSKQLAGEDTFPTGGGLTSEKLKAMSVL